MGFKIRVGTSRASAMSDISSVAESAGAIPQIPYEDLQRSTDNWNQANILGKGGFGIVFKGSFSSNFSLFLIFFLRYRLLNLHYFSIYSAD